MAHAIENFLFLILILLVNFTKGENLVSLNQVLKFICERRDWESKGPDSLQEELKGTKNQGEFALETNTDGIPIDALGTCKVQDL